MFWNNKHWEYWLWYMYGRWKCSYKFGRPDGGALSWRSLHITVKHVWKHCRFCTVKWASYWAGWPGCTSCKHSSFTHCYCLSIPHSHHKSSWNRNLVYVYAIRWWQKNVQSLIVDMQIGKYQKRIGEFIIWSLLNATYQHIWWGILSLIRWLSEAPG